MLVSIHIPKTAGTSFSISLLERFGRAMHRDYDHRLFQEDCSLDRKRAAMQSAGALRAEDYASVPCVHGHFLGLKYSLLAEQMPCTFVTWLRHPVARLMSQYHYQFESFDPAYAYGLQRRCVEEGWSFERYCLYEDYRNLQSQLLWGLPLSTFGFVGLTEHYEEDFARFCARYLGGPMQVQRVNATKSKPGLETLDPGLRRTIEEFHSLDMALYEAAVARRRRELVTGEARAAIIAPAVVVAPV